MSCLHRQWSALEATVGVLIHADAVVAERAVGLVDALPVAESCRRWLVDAPSDVPAGGELRNEYDSLAAALAQAHVLQRAGSSDKAHELVLAQQSRVLALDVGSLTTEMLLVLGTLEIERGELDTGRATLRDALARAREVESPRLEAEAWMRLADAAGDDVESGRFHARMGASVAESIGGDEAIAAWSELVQGRLAFVAGNDGGARRHLERALELHRSLYGDDDRRVATTLVELGRVVASGGELERAGKLLDRALSMRERVLGEQHPEVAEVHAALGSLALLRGHTETAIERHQGAIDMMLRHRDPMHVDVGRLRAELARAYEAAGELDRAEAELRQARVADATAWGGDDPRVTAIDERLEALAAARAKLSRADDE